MAYEYEKEYPINVSSVLGKLNLSRSGYSSYKNRLNAPSLQQQRKVAIKHRILSIHYDSGEIYGAPKICQELRKEGHKISEKTVGNSMREMGLRVCYVKLYTVTTIDPDFDSRLRKSLERELQSGLHQ